MNAVVSGHSGVALLIEGDALSSIRFGEDEVRPRRPSDFRLLFNGARDLQFLEDVELEEVRNRLDFESTRIDALHLALILLDDELAHDTRRTAAEELEELLAEEVIAGWLEGVLYAHPLPKSGDLVGARSACTGRTPRTRTFLEKLESFQPRIAEAREAWERIPIRLFGSEQEQVHALTMAVRDGFFRHLVVHSAGDATVDSLLSLGTVEGQNVESYRPILLAWISALSEGGARHPEAVTGPSVVAEPRAQEHVGSPESGDPGESPHLANLARLATESCTVESAGSERKLADLRALAWGQYADALRVNGRLREANEALASADRWCENGTRDPVLRARLLLQSASLRTAEGRFSEAIDLAEDAAGVFREIGWTQATARALVQKAIACHHSGMPEEAIAVLNRAIPLIEPEPDPQLLLAACHNLVQSYIALGRQEQALSLYFEIRDLYKEFGNDLILIRVGWQEGQLLRDLGHLHAAEAALLRARKGFMERNLMLEVAHVSLDLAWVYVKLGSLDMLKQTVAEAVPIFVALRANREALAALLQLQHEKGEQMFELLRALSNWLSPSSSVLRPIEVQLDFDGMDVSRRRGD